MLDLHAYGAYFVWSPIEYLILLFPGRESYVTKAQIEKVLKAGANIVFTTKGIDHTSLKVCFHYPSSSCSCSYFKLDCSYSFSSTQVQTIYVFCLTGP